uniref:Venom peptide U12-SYTX-Sth1a_1 n=1 Tax=Scytodes thoracica TaxID=1112478 RepID=A0A0A0V6A0_SCYTH|nr:venom peptide U12-SYTX-Sth1a_1 [Scytodes thoracica]
MKFALILAFALLVVASSLMEVTEASEYCDSPSRDLSKCPAVNCKCGTHLDPCECCTRCSTCPGERCYLYGYPCGNGSSCKLEKNEKYGTCV